MWVFGFFIFDAIVAVIDRAVVHPLLITICRFVCITSCLLFFLSFCMLGKDVCPQDPYFQNDVFLFLFFLPYSFVAWTLSLPYQSKAQKSPSAQNSLVKIRLGHKNNMRTYCTHKRTQQHALHKQALWIFSPPLHSLETAPSLILSKQTT